MNQTMRCLREHMVNARTHDQLIALLIYYKHKNPGIETFHVDDLLPIYKQVDLREPSSEQIARVLTHQAYFDAHKPGTFGVQGWLLDKYRDVYEPCLKTSLRIRFLDAYEASMGWIQQRFPVVTRVLIVGSVLYGITSFGLVLAQLAAMFR